MIPNIIHFTFGLKKDFDEIPFALPHYLAIKSAHEINKPDKIFFHYHWQPVDNIWWEKAKKYVEMVRHPPPTVIYGNKIIRSAHMADVIRLRVLDWAGGIYLDIDTLCVKPLDVFRHHKFVIGQQDWYAACNAVMMAVPNSEFGRLWMESFCSFDGEKEWDEHAVRMPFTISKVRPDLVHVEDNVSFLYPNFLQLPLLFETCIDNMDKKYVYHLWERCSWKDYLEHMDENWIRTSPSTYGVAARQFI